MLARALKTMIGVIAVMSMTGGVSAGAGLPSTVDAWTTAFKSLPIYGDGMASCDLGGGRRAFVTGDAVPRDGSAWAHSTITVVSGSGGAKVSRPAYAGVPSPYQVVPDTAADWHWLGPCVATGQTMYVLAPHVAPVTGGLGFTSLGVDLLRFGYSPTGIPAYRGSTAMPTTPGVSWAAGLAVSGGYLYVFGSSDAATDGWTGHDVYVARIPITSWFLSGGGTWRYWGPGGFSTARTMKPVLVSTLDGGVETSFSVMHDAAGWHLTSKVGGAWGPGAIAEWSSPALGARWGQRELVAHVPDGSYIAWRHYGLKLADGSVPLTYNLPGHDAVWLATR